MWHRIFYSRGGRRLWTVAFVVLCTVTLFLALWPLTAPVASTGWDKTDHLVGFAALSLTGVWMLPDQARPRAQLVLGLLALGGIIEILQMFIPHRQGDVYDWLADAIGVVAGWAVAGVVRRWFTPTGPVST